MVIKNWYEEKTFLIKDKDFTKMVSLKKEKTFGEPYTGLREHNVRIYIKREECRVSLYMA